MWKAKLSPFRRKTANINRLLQSSDPDSSPNCPPRPSRPRPDEAMDDPPVKHGYLCTPPQGKILKRTWQKKYYALYKASNYAVERVEVFDNEDSFVQNSSSRKIIPLNDCVKVTQAPQKHQQNVFDVITKSQIYQFSAETTQDLSEWLQAFQMVAFGGGSRRDVGPSTPPPPHSSYSSGHSQTSSSSSINAEEENQIYSSFSGPEVYVVKIVETEASVHCGLQGSYLLVISSIQLVLLEEGSNVNGKKYLFAWPYRHIRRYGRSKEVFTFEAGRKCTSGAGTFTFSTSDANAIFLSVQANTRTLKREEEDAALLTPSVVLSRSVQSWPVADDDASIRSQSASCPPRLPGNLFDITSPGSTSSKVESKELQPTILDRVLSRNKALPPFAKPPRKSKLPSTNGSEEKSPASEPIRFELSGAARAKLAKSASSTSISVIPEPTYAEPEVRSDAWKLFAMESDNFHNEKVPVETPYEDGGALYASITVSPSTQSPTTPWTPPAKKDVPKILMALKRPADSGCYDHLSPIIQQAPQPMVSPDGHIYTRLVNVVANDLAQMTTLANATPAESGTNDGTGHLVTDNGADSMDSQTPQQDYGEDIKRFLQNDDIYTAVAKPLKKTNSKPNNV